ncbi:MULTISPECIES: PGPGW domain-containing protein [unclassified Nocardioides]|uniref:PGPGW domain-containing protein n=1 Tax=unclassified Nocardioides TaxID=2615069 RepID=UPI003612DD56
MAHSLSPRAHALLTRVEQWSEAGPVRAVAVKVLVTVGGPLIVLAGTTMLVLPGPGLVVIALGFALLALEYAWARRVLHALGSGLARLRTAVFPPGATRTRRAVGVLGTGAFIAGSTALTSAITALVGTQTVL